MDNDTREQFKEMVEYACTHTSLLYSKSPAEFFIEWQRITGVRIKDFATLLAFLSCIKGLRTKDAGELEDLLEHL